MDSLGGAPPEEPPKSLAGRASFAMVLLLLTIPANLWVIVADLDYLDFLNRLIEARRSASPRPGTPRTWSRPAG